MTTIGTLQETNNIQSKGHGSSRGIVARNQTWLTRVSTDKRSGIVNDPNHEDDERYILRLIGQVITVSLETVRIVNSLPPLNLGS